METGAACIVTLAPESAGVLDSASSLWGIYEARAGIATRRIFSTRMPPLLRAWPRGRVIWQARRLPAEVIRGRCPRGPP